VTSTSDPTIFKINLTSNNNFPNPLPSDYVIEVINNSDASYGSPTILSNDTTSLTIQIPTGLNSGDINLRLSNLNNNLTLIKAFNIISLIPTIVLPTASSITYGQSLINSILSSGSASVQIGSNSINVEGTFACNFPTARPNVGTSNISITFTPIYKIYNPVTSEVSLTVNKVTPTINTSPRASSVNYGVTLSNSELSNGSASVNDNDILGVFSFVNGDFVSVFDSGYYEAQFIPDDPNYNSVANIMVYVSLNPDGGVVSCYNEGTKILCLTHGLEEKYIPIENLRSGDLVKTYKHGYRKIDLIGKKVLLNNYNYPASCMFIMKKTDTNGLTEDLIVTGLHSILVDEKGEKDLEMVDDKYLLMAKDSEKFEALNNISMYTYYHLCLENENGDERYGIWASGVLSETTPKNHFTERNFMLLK
jgi:hypothetical protein